jgi:hypothetical protein
MLRTPPHPGDQADRTQRLLAAGRVALASQVRWPRPGLPTGPTSSREATP